MKIPHFGMNPDNCKAGNFEAGCQRWNIPTYCIQYCTDCCRKEIWWKNWNTRYDFPFRQNAAKFGERIETPDMIFPSDRMLQNLVKALKHQTQFFLQTECCKICWKNWNTRYNFPFRQNAAQANSHPACWSCGLLQANLERGRLLNTTQYWTLLCHHCNHSTLRQAVVCGALLWLQANWLAFSDLNKK